MRPTFLGFETARKGLMASQKGLDISGHNVTNMYTEGYTRQRVDQVSVASSRYGSRFATSRSEFAGQGVDINGISQIRDSFLDKRFREEYGDVGYHDQVYAALSDMEGVLNEIKEEGIKGALNQIVKQLQTFSSNADSVTHSNIVATEFKNLCNVLHQFSQKLDNVSEQQKYSLSMSVDEINSQFVKIANLNEAIRDEQKASSISGSEHYGPNELLDQRNLLLDQLSRFGELEVQPQTDGTVTVTMSGHTVIKGGDYEQINFTRNDDVDTVSLTWQSNNQNINLSTGALRGALDMINGRGLNAKDPTECTAKGVLYYKDKINAFANTLVDVVNHTIPETQEVNGEWVDVPGKYKTLLQSTTVVPKTEALGNVIPGEYETETTRPVTAANISISDEWSKDPGYAVYKSKNLNSNPILKLLENMTTGEFNFRFAGQEGDGEYTGTFQDYVTDYNTTYGSEMTYHETRLKACISIADELTNRRDEISGVSFEEEGSNVMLYQKSFSACSRVMTALDDALDILINRTGRVGL